MRKLLVATFEFLQATCGPVVACAKFLGVPPSTLYGWAAKAKAQGVASLDPWAGRAYSETERELLAL